MKQVLRGAPEEGAVGLEIGVGEALEGLFPGRGGSWGGGRCCGLGITDPMVGNKGAGGL